ncbi:MAG TPA: sulfatase-like hydrolase/transferase [Verrucomicrobiae bacterium]|nr:sulfatase-like hydrolase/transferase [Verrucomicrobiae bacterium]
MNRRQFLHTAAGAAAFNGVSWPRIRGVPQRPNILFILVDDLGYADLSCYGRPDYQTPVLDRMAREGMKFTDAYASAPVCTPSRCAFHTGRYPQRLPVGLAEPLVDDNMQLGLPPDHPTIGTQLKKAGYDTILIGKWHLGNVPQFGPNQHGFDEFFGINGSAADYFTHYNNRGRPDLFENLKPSDQQGYLTDLFTNRALEYLARPHPRPFFMSLQYNAPHWPWEGPQDRALATNYARENDASNDVYAAMVKSMDSGIGRIFEALHRHKLDRRTLVVFTSDNGGDRYSLNWPFQFQKFYLWEGGIRIPAIVRWPGVVPAGRVTNQAVATMDWAATFLDVAGARADPAFPFDGESVMAVCAGKRPAFDRAIFWRVRARPQAAARVGKWKYLQDRGEEFLFDLAADPGESTDLKGRQPDVFEKTRDAYNKWNSTMLP